MSKEYKGTIIQESLIDDRILNKLEIIGYKITQEDNPEERWHLFDVVANEKDIEKLSAYLKPKKWYADFKKDNEVIIVFPNRTFRFDSSNVSARQEAIEFGKTLDIPLEQLDF